MSAFPSSENLVLTPIATNLGGKRINVPTIKTSKIGPIIRPVVLTIGLHVFYCLVPRSSFPPFHFTVYIKNFNLPYPWPVCLLYVLKTGFLKSKLNLPWPGASVGQSAILYTKKLQVRFSVRVRNNQAEGSSLVGAHVESKRLMFLFRSLPLFLQSIKTYPQMRVNKKKSVNQDRIKPILLEILFILLLGKSV